jgi:hypothetical protein
MMKSCCEHRNLPQPVLPSLKGLTALVTGAMTVLANASDAAQVPAMFAAAVWLASDFSACSVGTTRFIDGGLTLYPSFEMGA